MEEGAEEELGRDDDEEDEGRADPEASQEDQNCCPEAVHREQGGLLELGLGK